MFKFRKDTINIVIPTSTTSLINVSPNKFSDSSLIAKELLKGNALVVDINGMEKVEAIRFIDFITGVLFTTKGGFEKIADKVYLIAPSKRVLEKFKVELDKTAEELVEEKEQDEE